MSSLVHTSSSITAATDPPTSNPHPHSTPTSSFPAPRSVADLHTVQQNALKVHAKDLLSTLSEQQGFTRGTGGRLHAFQIAAKSPTAALIGVIISSVFSLIAALLSNPALPFTSPIDFGYSLLAMSFLTGGLILCDIGLWAFEKLGGYNLVALLSSKHSDNFSIINMADPGMFSRPDSLAVIHAANDILSSTFRETHHHGPSGERIRQASLGGSKVVEMNLDVAKTLLILSSLVYERKEAQVADAAMFAQWSMQRLFASEQKIHEVAATYNMRFASMSDFTSVSGSYAGIFYPETGKAWMVIAMKGTTPSNFNEFLVDSRISQEDATSHLFGACHEGFYSSLFPSQSSGTHVNPHRRICQIIHSIYDELRVRGQIKKGEKVPLWITGHSLGGALASVLYARFLNEQEDLGDKVQLRDGYVFGCPRVGDAKFCAEFEKLLEKPKNATRSLWRVCNGADLVTKVPPGLADNEEFRLTLKPASLLNYGFIGTAIHLDKNASCFYKVGNRGTRVGDVVLIVESGAGHAPYMTDMPGEMPGDSPSSASALPNSAKGKAAMKIKHDDARFFAAMSADMPPVKFGIIWVASSILKYFAPWLRDHFPSRYFAGLSRVDGLIAGRDDLSLDGSFMAFGAEIGVHQRRGSAHKTIEAATQTNNAPIHHGHGKKDKSKQHAHANGSSTPDTKVELQNGDHDGTHGTQN